MALVVVLTTTVYTSIFNVFTPNTRLRHLSRLQKETILELVHLSTKVKYTLRVV